MPSQSLGKALWIFLLIAIGFTIRFAFFSDAPSIPEPKMQVIARPTPALLPPFKTQNHSLKTITAPPAGNSVPERFMKAPKDQIVDFKIVDGLAIAYGDTVLGKPAPGFAPNAGLTEIRGTQIWKSNEIPYAIDDTIKNKSAIQQAIDLFQTRTNLKFVPYANQEDAIVFTKGQENCMSSLGRIGGLQAIYLEDRCGKIEIAHEIMHALGFVHEQSRTDRDQYITIAWENIQPDYQSQFAMIPEVLMDVYGDTPFDPTSILMYGPHIFSTDPHVDTMKLLSGAPIENAPMGLSEIDITRINRLYRN